MLKIIGHEIKSLSRSKQLLHRFPQIPTVLLGQFTQDTISGFINFDT